MNRDTPLHPEQSPVIQAFGSLAHEFLLQEARPLAREAAAAGDDGSNDLIVGQVVRRNELQSWFVLRHLTLPAIEP